MRQPRQYAHLVKPDGLIVNLKELKAVEIASVEIEQALTKNE